MPEYERSRKIAIDYIGESVVGKGARKLQESECAYAKTCLAYSLGHLHLALLTDRGPIHIFLFELHSCRIGVDYKREILFRPEVETVYHTSLDGIIRSGIDKKGNFDENVLKDEITKLLNIVRSYQPNI
jgi:hypothetical protein